MEKFSRLTLAKWRQFDSVDIDLSRQVTILTGQNGCGKTTILNLLNRHFGWSLHFVSTPYYGRKAERFWSDVWKPTKDTRASSRPDEGSSDAPQHNEVEPDETRPEPPANAQVTVGQITYTSGRICELRTSTIVGAQYQPHFTEQQAVQGLHIPSHRPVATYNHIGQIPTDPTTAAQSYQQFQNFLAQSYGGQPVQNPGRVQKQSIISLAVFGEGNSSVKSDPQLREVFEKFQEVLRHVMPPELGFERLEVRMPEVVCITKSGDFSLDAMSGGVNALFSIAWQIHMFGHDKETFVITIDEPENHLHPSMQRTLLPSLALAFPNCDIIAATHSPFIVSSFPEANVYALSSGVNGGIVSEQLDTAAISRTPNDILREILDVRSNLPVWVENKIAQIISGTAGSTAERARLIMEELERLGFAEALLEYKRGDLNANGH
jgi:predicted ATPase